ncbi:MAG TPA: HTH domain-containing protein [Thermoprotei archaeon]|nr:HTH domain-containing protein [Thermoprotei archaeon]
MDKIFIYEAYLSICEIMNRIILDSLTSTERRIVEEYLKNKEISPKELAIKLNVSIRTVYKALYKYRRELRRIGNIEEAERLKRKRGRRPKKIVNDASFTSSSGEYISDSLSNVASKAIYDAIYHYILSMLKEGVFKIDINEINLLVNSINELRKSIVELNQNIIYLIENKDKIIVTNKIKIKNNIDEKNSNEELPSFLIDNPWIEVLKERN